MAGTTAIQNKTLLNSEYNKYIKAQTQTSEIEDYIAIIEEKMDLIYDAMNSYILKGENEEQIKSVFNPRIQHFNNKLNEKVLISNLNYKFKIFIYRDILFQNYSQ